MTHTVAIPILVVGVLSGATAAGILAHALNYAAGAGEGFRWGTLFGYVLILSAGVTIEYGHPTINVIASFVGVVIIGGRIFEFITKKLPQESTLRAK